jgi:hypothetical protein
MTVDGAPTSITADASYTGTGIVIPGGPVGVRCPDSGAAEDWEPVRGVREIRDRSKSKAFDL